jgi:hypothetical protein
MKLKVVGFLLLIVVLSGCSKKSSSDDPELGTGTSIQVDGGTILQLENLNKFTGYVDPVLTDSNRTLIQMTTSGNSQTLQINFSDLGITKAGSFDVNLIFEH